MKRGVAEAAQIVGVGKEQIKVWSRLFREYLNKDASPAQGQERQYADKDILIFLYVGYYWEDHPDIESIKIGLNQENYYEDAFIHELYRHTPLLQDEIPEVDEPYILISVENFKSACRFLASFPSFFSDDACIALQKTTGNPLKNHLRIF